MAERLPLREPLPHFEFVGEELLQGLLEPHFEVVGDELLQGLLEPHFEVVGDELLQGLLVLVRHPVEEPLTVMEGKAEGMGAEEGSVSLLKGPDSACN